jgi:hypothetical protein
MDVLLLGMAKTITAGASRIYRSLALSSNDLAESYAKAREYNGVAISAACPAFGTKRTWQSLTAMSAFGGKADIDRMCRRVRF